MQWAAAVAHRVVTLVSSGASRHMLAAEAVVVAVVWKDICVSAAELCSQDTETIVPINLGLRVRRSE